MIQLEAEPMPNREVPKDIIIDRLAAALLESLLQQYVANRPAPYRIPCGTQSNSWRFATTDSPTEAANSIRAAVNEVAGRNR